ncbi:unnamed protein product [Schistosoma curassoni]|uniref:Gag protein n=1 Tax=Schistosoma curassoni TaxID=6186 RepID=A0A183KL24_9TREM|nr:unnamed protein product [Schistosoma curassoni]
MFLEKTRAIINIGTLNVRTMWETGRTNRMAMKLRRCILAVLGISETHWIQAGRKTIGSGEMLLYAVHMKENAPNTQRMALVLSKEANKAPEEWEYRGPMIMDTS